MAGQVVEMDYPVMQSVAKGFRTQADIMNAIGKALVMMFESLEKSLWFTGLGAYFGRCKDATKQKTKELVAGMPGQPAALGAVPGRRAGPAGPERPGRPG